MEGFDKITDKKARLLEIRDGVQRQLLAARISLHRGRAALMIADTVRAALDPAGPRAAELNVRFIRQQADGLETTARAAARLAFLHRQRQRLERKLSEEE